MTLSSLDKFMEQLGCRISLLFACVDKVFGSDKLYCMRYRFSSVLGFLELHAHYSPHLGSASVHILSLSLAASTATSCNRLLRDQSLPWKRFMNCQQMKLVYDVALTRFESRLFLPAKSQSLNIPEALRTILCFFSSLLFPKRAFKRMDLSHKNTSFLA
ncbi:unnamed protein product [Albugo candida]|uniref:Uncharacterized protein n=1 Tax=Albugo candida TaxID=65357 RepID=A0A024GCX8_9STRA|nr:unnamed protein product [Albugo candida]|eukprot:CCI44532.1 unnamed protein product [Albugo candida]